MNISDKAFTSFRKEVLAGFFKMQHGIESLDARMNGTENRLDSLDAHMNGTENRLDSLNARMNGTENRLDSLNVRMDETNNRLDSLDARMVAGFSKTQHKIDFLDRRVNETNNRFDSLNARTDETNNRLDSIRTDVGHLHHTVYKLDIKVDDLSKDLVNFIHFTGDHVSKLQDNFEQRLVKLESHR